MKCVRLRCASVTRWPNVIRGVLQRSSERRGAKDACISMRPAMPTGCTALLRTVCARSRMHRSRHRSHGRKSGSSAAAFVLTHTRYEASAGGLRGRTIHGRACGGMPRHFRSGRINPLHLKMKRNTLQLNITSVLIFLPKERRTGCSITRTLPSRIFFPSSISSDSM